MKPLRAFSLALAFLMLFGFVVFPMAQAQISKCDSLTPAQKKTAADLFERLHPYGGCDDTFARCLQQPEVDPLVRRLAADLCRQIASGKDAPTVERGFSRRAQSMMSASRPVSFNLDPAMSAGTANAPLTLVVFACVRCPFCRVMIPALHEAVTKGALKDKAVLYFKPFPIKDHPGALEGGLAMIAGAELNRFWPLTLSMYARYDDYCPKNLAAVAAEAGMNIAAFNKTYADSSTRQALAESKKEGLKYRVASTPTLFINGQKYLYDLDMDSIMDVVEEHHESVPRVSP
jgi:protein-disulfide isomerase